MKHKFFLFGFLLILGHAHAQYESFFGQQTWSYNIVYPVVCFTDDYDPNLLGCSQTHSYSFDKNNVMNIQDTLYYQCGNTYSNAICLREDTINGKLYGRYGLDNYEKEYLICDLSLSEGDTFTLQNNFSYGHVFYWFYSSDNSIMRVDSISYPFGKKVLHLSLLTEEDMFIPIGFYNVNYRFMEGIGPMLGICPQGFYDVESSGFLLCMHKDEALYYMTHEDLGCYQYGSKIDEYPLFSINIYPNPASENITLDFITENEISGTVIIRDIIGRVCKQVDIHSKTSVISISDLPQGIYILTFIDENYRKLTKKIVKS
jgi:hypothetical protein